MSKEQEQLLMKDLCGRLPYGVKASYYGPEEECECIDEIEGLFNDGQIDIGQYGLDIWKVRPYLFPLSSMTEEQKEYLRQNQIIIAISTSGIIETTTEGFDWLNANHFDYRGLISQGLAINATGTIIYNKEE